MSKTSELLVINKNCLKDLKIWVMEKMLLHQCHCWEKGIFISFEHENKMLMFQKLIDESNEFWSQIRLIAKMVTGLRFCVDSQVRHETPEEGRKTYWPKCCKYNNNEVNSLNILSSNNQWYYLTDSWGKRGLTYFTKVLVQKWTKLYDWSLNPLSTILQSSTLATTPWRLPAFRKGFDLQYNYNAKLPLFYACQFS